MDYNLYRKKYLVTLLNYLKGEKVENNLLNLIIMSYIIYALLGAIFTSLTTILAKIGIKNVNSNFATFYRCVFVLISAFLMCIITGCLDKIFSYDLYNYIFLIISGISTGLSWLCYYKALKLTNVNVVAPIDKSSFIFTTILLVIFFFDESTNNGNPLTIILLIITSCLMLIGTLLMIDYKNDPGKITKKGIFYAVLSALFASFVSLFIKMGLKNVDTVNATFIRTLVVIIFSFCICLSRKNFEGAKKISKKSYLFLSLSGASTFLAWLFEYSALNALNSNAIVANNIGKLAILFTMGFSYFVLKEKFTKKSILGLGLLVLGIFLLTLSSLIN